MKTIILSLLISTSALADTFYKEEKMVICNYDLTIPLKDGTVKFIAVPLIGKQAYKVRDDYGHVLLGVDFSKDLKKINQDHWYNHKFIDNVDEYKCKDM